MIQVQMRNGEVKTHEEGTDTKVDETWLHVIVIFKKAGMG